MIKEDKPVEGFRFPIDKPMKYALTGKFEAPSPYWMHSDLPLDEYELFVVTKGTMYLSYNNKRYTVPSGQFLLLPPVPPPNNRRKGFQPSDCIFYWLHFSCDDEVLHSSNHNSNPAVTKSVDYLSIPLQAAVPQIDKMIVLMKQLQDSLRSDYSYTSLCYLTTTILCELHNQLHRNHESTPAKKTQKQIYYDIIDHIKSNIHRPLKVADVAKHFGYNDKYLSHLFRSITGIPLKQYILNTKMDYANYLLTDTNQSIKEISLALGISDSHNFTKVYKKIIGLTPTEYRNAFSKRVLNH